jgi:hypothetical protein
MINAADAANATNLPGSYDAVFWAKSETNE